MDDSMADLKRSQDSLGVPDDAVSVNEVKYKDPMDTVDKRKQIIELFKKRDSNESCFKQFLMCFKKA